MYGYMSDTRKYKATRPCQYRCGKRCLVQLSLEQMPTASALTLFRFVPRKGPKHVRRLAREHVTVSVVVKE